MAGATGTKRAGTPTADRGVIGSAAAAGVWLLLAVLMCYLAGRIYTDWDGWTLLNIADPLNYDAATAFGFFFHPLYVLGHGSIVWLRLGGFCLLSLCGWYFAAAVAGFTGIADRRGWLTGAIALGVMFWFGKTGLTVPDYNQLNLCGLLLIFGGLLAATPPRAAVAGPTGSPARFMISAAVPAGAGFAICLLDKATSAVAAGLLAVAWMLVLRPPRRWSWWLATGAAGALLYTVAIELFYGGFGNFARVLRASLSRLGAWAPGLPRWDQHGMIHALVGSFPPLSQIGHGGGQGILTALLGVSVVFAWARSWTLDRDPSRAGRLFSIGFPILLSLLFYLPYALIEIPVIHRLYHGTLLIPFLTPLLGLAMALAVLKGPDQTGDRRRILAAALILALAPLAYYIGTNTGLNYTCPQAAAFWFGALFLLLPLFPSRRRRALAATLAAFSCVAALSLWLGLLVHATPGLVAWQQRTPIEVGPDRARILVSAPEATYLETFAAQAGAHGFRPGDTVTDLTNDQSFVLFALAGRPREYIPGSPLTALAAQWAIDCERPGEADSLSPYTLVARVAKPAFELPSQFAECSLWQRSPQP